MGVGSFTQNTTRPENLVDFLETRPIRAPKVSPRVKSEMRKKVPRYMIDSSMTGEDINFTKEDGSPAHFNQTSPDTFMKHMDTSFESFFYQRDYSERNFTFYL